MAKKTVVTVDEAENNDGNGKKKIKKRSWCCTCLIVLAAFFMIIFALAFSAGWVIGDMVSKQYIGMPIGKTLGLVNELYWTDDGDVVTNPYTAADKQGFYNEIKGNILLKADADIDFDAALENALEEYLSDGGQGESKSVAKLNADGSYDYGEGGEPSGDPSVGGDGDDGGKESSVADVFMGMIAEVFTRDNIDTVRLSEYDEDNDTYVFNLNDRQLAAFIDGVLRIMLKKGMLESLGEYADMIDFSKVIALKQIKFNAVTTVNAQNEKIITATTADVTVWVGLQSVAHQALSKLVDDAGYGWSSGLVGWLADVILPENLFATIGVPLYGENAKASVSLNAMTDEQRDAMYKLVDNFMNGEGGLEKMLGEYGDVIKPYLEKAKDHIDFTSASQGTIQIDLLGAMANIASEGLEGEERLEKADFMYMLQAVLTSSEEARLVQLQPYLFDKWYRTPTGDFEYDPADKTGKTPVDYEKEFVNAIEDKYAVDFGEDAKLADVLKLFGIDLAGGGEGGSSVNPDDMLDMISKERFKSNLSKTTEELKLYVSDRMLASALGGQMSALTGDIGMDMTLKALTFVSGSGEKSHRTYALLAVEADISGMLGGDNMLMQLASNVLPEKLLLSVTIDVTRSLASGETYDGMSFMLNDYENTDRVISSLQKLAGIDLASNLGEVETMFRDMMNEMYEKLNITVVPSVVESGDTSSGALVLPDIFTMINSMVINDPDIEAEELRVVLQALVNPPREIAPQPADNYLGDIIDKYYIDADEEPATFDDLVDLVSSFDTNTFRLTPPETGASDKPYLAHDAREAAQLHPVISGAELARLIKEKSGGSATEGTPDGGATAASPTQNYDIIRVDTSASELTVTLEVKNIAELLPEDIMSILDIERLYVTAEVDVSKDPDITAYPVKVTVNDMDETTFASMMKIVNHFSDGSFDLQGQVDDFGRILYEQISSLENGLGMSIDFTDEGLELASFYEFLAVKLNIRKASVAGETDEYVNEETVKAALQGMFERPESGAYSPYNYVRDDFVVNAPTADTSYDPDKFGDPEFVAGTKNITFTDREFNGYFESLMITGGLNGAHVVQTIALDSADPSARAKAVRDKFNEKCGETAISTDKDYLLLTFELTVEKSDAEDKSNGFLPSNVLVTVALERNVSALDPDKDEFVSRGIVFNDMSADAKNVLLQLMNLSEDSQDESKVNINSVLNECLTALNGNGADRKGLTDGCRIFVKASTAADCYGEIEFENKRNVSLPVSL